MIKKNLLIVFLWLSSIAAIAQSSVLSSGTWYKFLLASDGVFKIDYALLQKAGIDPSKIDPKKIRIYTGQPGMLPQANNMTRVSDLKEIPITVVGEGDGKFDGTDYILFYGKGPDDYFYDLKSGFFSYQNNLYSKRNFYYLTCDLGQGKRIHSRQSIDGNFPIINTFDSFAYYENDQYNLLHSGRQWFGEQFDQSLQITVQFDVSGIVPNSNIKITSHVMAQSISDCSFNVTYNGSQLLTQQIQAVPNEAFAIKGRVVADTLTVNETSVHAASQSNQQIHYQFSRGASGISIGYLDYVLFSMQRMLALYNEQTFFTSASSLSNAVSSFKINSVSNDKLVWDLTDAFNVKEQVTQLSGNNFTFSTNTDSLKRFIVFDPAKISKPIFDSKVLNQNLHGITSADFVIISHPSLIDQANRLATHRQTHDQLDVKVVSTEQVYNEFGGGKADPTSIRDFIRYVYKKSNGQLKYALLFGRGSYDYKDRVYSNTNLVPIYESYNSLDPLATYSSDDYFGFLDDNEGAWTEEPAVNYAMDVGIGRIPAKNINEAQSVVDKLIDYDTNTDRFGAWRKHFLFVADDGDNTVHESQSDQLADNIEANHADFDAKKLFLDQFKQVMKPIGQFSPDAKKALDLAIREGKSIVNYTGHGSEKVWTQELILDEDFVLSLNNAPKYPLFVTATCEFGRNDDPFIISSAELLTLQKKGGAIGMVTTARPVYSSTNFQLNQAFYQALFIKNNSQFRRLGAIMMDTKNNSLNGISNRNFSLLGDPSMKLALPDDGITTTQIKTSNNSDTLKALSQVIIKGEVQRNGVTLSNFSGTVYATLFDKIQNLISLGDPAEIVNPPSPPYNYIERSNKLFQGTASATQGRFQFNFEMPQELVQGINKGKLGLYAFQDDGTEATGFSTSFFVGGVEPNPTVDTTPPVIKLFLSDTTFANGGTIGPNTKLVAQLYDESGINITTLDPQNNVIAILDNKWSYILNDYYLCKKDDFRNGFISYPLDTLKKGTHTLSLSASDTHGNRSSVSIVFSVTEGSGIRIGDFGNYPNPFETSSGTTFHFTHTQAGEDLEVTLIIYDFVGKPLHRIEYQIPVSEYQVTLQKWNGSAEDGTKINPGIYLARLFVRSADGSQSDRAVKLIILN